MSFQFKQFSIEDEQCAMKIGTDGCLLGAWADVINAKNILDIGTGCGIVAIMLAQRSNSTIDAVEIDNSAYKQSCENFLKSPWAQRLNAFNTSIQEYVKANIKKYDLIVSCPPYFLNSMKAADKKRNLARHTDSLTFEELLSCTRRKLNPEGKFCTIIPAESVKIFRNHALIEGFFVTKITEVLPKAGFKPVRSLLQMELSKKNCFCDNVTILDKKGKAYTEEYKKLTGEFYINF